MGSSVTILASIFFFLVGSAAGNVVLLGKNVSRAFDDVDAGFTPKIKGSGENGILYLAEPLDACAPLVNKVVEGSMSRFILITRGGCSFDDKVRRAQDAGYRAAVIYDNEDEGPLVEMAGVPGGIKIHAVFISKASGKVLKTYAGRTDLKLWIIPNYDNSTWSIMAVSFILLLAVSAAVGTCFFVQRQYFGRGRSRVPRVQEFHGMSHRSVKAMPSLFFTTDVEDNGTSRTCAICLEDYNVGEKLRVLPCHHKFHAGCVDSWLTIFRTFCPMCKQDARMSTDIPPPSEYTPLLSFGASSPSSTAGSMSFHSTLPVPIVLPPSWSRPASRTHSLSGTSRIVNSYKSYNNSPCANRSFGNLRIASSLSSRMSNFISPHSSGLPLSTPTNSRYMCPYISGRSSASPSFLAGSSGRLSYLRNCESGASLASLVSAESLPGC